MREQHRKLCSHAACSHEWCWRPGRARSAHRSVLTTCCAPHTCKQGSRTHTGTYVAPLHSPPPPRPFRHTHHRTPCSSRLHFPLPRLFLHPPSPPSMTTILHARTPYARCCPPGLSPSSVLRDGASVTACDQPLWQCARPSQRFRPDPRRRAGPLRGPQKATNHSAATWRQRALAARKVWWPVQ